MEENLRMGTGKGRTKQVYSVKPGTRFLKFNKILSAQLPLGALKGIPVKKWTGEHP